MRNLFTPFRFLRAHSLQFVLLFLVVLGGTSVLVSQSGSGPQGAAKRSIIPAGEVGESGFLSIRQTWRQNWYPLKFRRSYQNPVVLVSLQTAKGIKPAIARARNVTATGCEVRIEWPSNENGPRIEESLAYLVIEAGYHVLSDGTVIDAGSRLIGKDWKQVRFLRPLPADGRVVCQVTSDLNSKKIIVPRIRHIDREGFEIKTDTEEAQNEAPRRFESLSWVAVSRSTLVTDTTMIRSGITSEVVDMKPYRVGLGRIGDGKTSPAFFCTLASDVNRDPAIPVVHTVRPYDAWVHLQEDTTADAETFLRPEKLHWLAVTPGIISTVQSDTDGDSLPDAWERAEFGSLAMIAGSDPDMDGLTTLDELRLGMDPLVFDPLPMLLAETRAVEQNRHDLWTQVSFNNQVISNPVVIASLQSNNGKTFATPRIRSINSVGCALKIEEGAKDDGIRVAESVGILVVEAGRHVLPEGGIIEAGIATVEDVKARFTRFSEPFPYPPILLTQVVSDRNHTPVLVRIQHRSKNGFSMVLDEEEALAKQVHGNELVAWVAFSRGFQKTLEGKWCARDLPEGLDLKAASVAVSPDLQSVFKHKKLPGLHFAQIQTSVAPELAGVSLEVNKDSTVSMRVMGDSVAAAHPKEQVGLVSLSRGVLAFLPWAADRDGNGIADSVEAAAGFSPDKMPASSRARGYFGDADHDGIPNFEEARRGLPLDSRQGIVEWEVFTKIPGRHVVNMMRSTKFLTGKSDIYQLPKLETPRFFDDNYGSRIRGLLLPAVSGNYQFFLTGNNETRLYLSSNATPFRKDLIARVNPGAKEAAPDNWFQNPEQVSKPIHLKAGDRYYMEVLHKEEDGDDFLQVAWIPPGETEVSVIPGKFWMSYRPIRLDADDDSMPDKWEEAVGLHSLDVSKLPNPLAQKAEYGDPDGDGLPNFMEFRLGTNPTKKDSDGDGVADGTEVELGTDPLIPPNRSTRPGKPISKPGLATYTGSFGNWNLTPDGTLSPSGRRGRITYEFTTPRDGIWIYEIKMRLKPPQRQKVPLEILVDGQVVGTHLIQHLAGESYLADGRTMHLKAGTHRLEIREGNVSVALTVELLSVGIFEPDGRDEDGNGIQDWLDQTLAKTYEMDQRNKSFVSPACLEGSGVFLDQTALLDAQGKPIPIAQSLEGRWFANVPLDAKHATSVTAIFESGALTQEASIDWVETSISDQQSVTVRVGDALKLVPGVKPGSPGPDQPRRVVVFSEAKPEERSEYELLGSNAVIHRFEEPGAFSVAVIGKKGSILASTKINVIAPEFGPVLSALVDEFNYWPIPKVPWSVTAEPEDFATYVEVGRDKPRAAWLDPGRTGKSHVLARTEPGGPIAAVGEIDGIELSTVLDTHENRVVESFSNGDRLVASSFAISGRLPQGWYVEVRTRAAGVMFDDGTRIARFYAGDFDAAGIARMKMYVPASVPTKNCHYLLLFDAEGNLVSSF